MTRAALFVRSSMRTLVLLLANGYIFFFFSERLFWSTYRPSDTMVDLMITLLAYSVVGYLVPALAAELRADSDAALFLVGAAYGWLLEGAVVTTLYGTDASAPFPISLSVTALSWHALISVMLGWHLMRRALASGGIAPVLVNAAVVGIFWGAWAPSQWFSQPPLQTDALAFLAYASLTTALLALSYWLLDLLALDTFVPRRRSIVLVLLLLTASFAHHLRTLGPTPLLVLPPLLLLVFTVLTVRRRRLPTPPQRPPDNRTARPLAYISLMTIPIWAVAVYSVALALGPRWPLLHGPMFVTLGFAGALTFFWSMAVILRRTDT